MIVSRGSQSPFECICQVIVLLPNNNRIQLSCKSDVTVRLVYETIVTYVDLIEHSLFGLTILIGEEQPSALRRSMHRAFRWRVLLSCDGRENIEVRERFEMEEWSSGLRHANENKALRRRHCSAQVRGRLRAERLSQFTLISLCRHFLTQHFFYLQFRQMILGDTFPTTVEQKLTLATLAFQAEYSGSADIEQVQRSFIVEHYASKDLVNRVGV